MRSRSIHRRPLYWLAALLAAALLPAAAQQPGAQALEPEVERLVNQQYAGVDALYKHLHQNPELSLQETRTAARLAQEMREIGFEVTENVGGTGVVAVLRNGEGPTILVRADMDGLPVSEATGLSWASTARGTDPEGNNVAVMHACGHDVHMASWVGTARVLHALRERWSGTLVFIGQPAEEIVAGARAMLEDDLFERFVRPDYALALHTGGFEAGKVGYTEGAALAAVDSVDIIVRGRGGHGSAPHTTIDPVVIAARIVLDLQTIVSREVNPQSPAVVTIGAIHGGTKRNIIPNEVKLELTVRSYDPEVRAHLLEAIERLAKQAAAGARAPEPGIVIHEEESVPPTINDVELTRSTVGLFREVFGEENVVEQPRSMGGEDFSYFGEAGIPALMFRVGIFPPERVRAAREGGPPLPSAHSDQYAPEDPEPVLKTGVTAMSMAVLNLLNRR